MPELGGFFCSCVPWAFTWILRPATIFIFFFTFFQCNSCVVIVPAMGPKSLGFCFNFMEMDINDVFTAWRLARISLVEVNLYDLFIYAFVLLGIFNDDFHQNAKTKTVRKTPRTNHNISLENIPTRHFVTSKMTEIFEKWWKTIGND